MSPPASVLRRGLVRLKRDMLDLEPAWRDSKAALVAGFQRAIQTKGGSIGQKWPPLPESYAKRVGRKHATLRVTGNLMSAIIGGQLSIVRNQQVTGARYRITNRAVSLVYKYPFLGVDSATMDGIRRKIGKHFDRQTRKMYQRTNAARKAMAR
jgi:hypothetical protein